jgi:hypothetical protein
MVEMATMAASTPREQAARLRARFIGILREKEKASYCNDAFRDDARLPRDQ